MESTDTLTTATVDEVYMYTGSGEVPKDVVSVHIHPSVTDIPASTFQNCRELKNVTINEGLVTIGSWAFVGCSELQSISFPSTLFQIGYSAFNGCANLREVVFNEGLKYIGTKSFEYCHSLESINFPSTLLKISNLAFNTCGLRVVELNERIHMIEDHVFAGCTALREVILLDEGVYNMGNMVFTHCPSLESFKLPCLSTRLESILASPDQRDVIMNKINGIQRLEKRDSELLIPARFVGYGVDWKLVRETLDRIINVLDYHEVKEATTSIELAFWKAEVKSKAEEINHNEIDRRGCCIDVPGPVKDTILQYLAFRIYPRGKREKQAFATNT